MYMATKKLRRGLRHSKKLRGGAGFFSGIFGGKPNSEVNPAQTNAAPKPQTNGPLTIEQLNAKINKINQRLDALEAKLLQ